MSLPQAIVTDIEGTTTSLSFVSDTLFPYARRHLADFVTQHQAEPRVAAEITATCQVMGKPDASLREVVDCLIDWIDRDQKITPLKALQGMIWEIGYQSGELRGHVYEDVPEALTLWQKRGICLAVYSSGSIAAQKLLFSHTVYGDITPRFSAYFDTTIGGKRENASYERIAHALNMSTQQMLFLSDIQEELDAAASSGMRTYGLERGTCGCLVNHPTARSFHDIAF